MLTGVTIRVTAKDRAKLEAILEDRNSPQNHVWRARIILLTADGCGTAAIMRGSGTSKTAVWRWQERFMIEGVAGLLCDKTRPSRIAPLGADVEASVVQATLSDFPSGETTHWTAPAMAKVQGISVSSVQRIWRRHGLQPHRTRQFKLSNDPQFAAKLRDIIGLYVTPPAHAMVLSIDEKSQIQALDRTQPGLPLKKGLRHDDARLQAAWHDDAVCSPQRARRKVVGRCMQKHRHQEYIRFLNAVEATVPTGKHVHAIVDNYATHQHPKVREWLEAHPWWTFHFTPTSASWLNAVEGFFAKSTKRRLARGIFHSVEELKEAIDRFLAENNLDPRPFQWIKKPSEILAAVRR